LSIADTGLAFVLAGGGSFGAIQVGMMHSLAAHGISPDMVVGSSVDGAISSNTPINVAVAKGATRLIIMPTGYACAPHEPPKGAVANALHALTLLIARQLVDELENLDPEIEHFVVPPLCPLVGSPYDFSRTEDHIARAIQTTDGWLARGGLEQSGIPGGLRPHSH
jgi:NTE family protein